MKRLWRPFLWLLAKTPIGMTLWNMERAIGGMAPCPFCGAFQMKGHARVKAVEFKDGSTRHVCAQCYAGNRHQFKPIDPKTTGGTA